MSEGGFVVKFDGKEITRCFAIAFDYDAWQYIVNNKEKKKITPTQIIMGPEMLIFNCFILSRIFMT